LTVHRQHSRFVSAEQTDPIVYGNSYYLAPDGVAAVRPYGLLVAARTKADRIGLRRS